MPEIDGWDIRDIKRYLEKGTNWYQNRWDPTKIEKVSTDISWYLTKISNHHDTYINIEFLDMSMI